MRRRRLVADCNDFPVTLPSSWIRLLYLEIALVFLVTTPDTFDGLMIKTFIWRCTILLGLFLCKSHTSPKAIMVLAITVLAKPVSSETVYDCSTANTAIATYSLAEIGECPDFKHQYRNKTHMRAQILQRSGAQMIEGFQCQLTYERSACYCGQLHARKSN